MPLLIVMLFQLSAATLAAAHASWLQPVSEAGAGKTDSSLQCERRSVACSP